MSGLHLPPLGKSIQEDIRWGITAEWDASVVPYLDSFLVNQICAPQMSPYWLSQAMDQAVYESRPQGQRQRLRWSR